MLIAIIQIIAIFLIPLIIIRYHQFKLTKLLGTIGMAYLIGLLVAFIIYGVNKLGVKITLNADIGEIGSFAAIGVSIPLLLFNANLKETKKLTKMVLVSFTSLTVSVILVASIMFFIYGRHLENGAILSAMSIGVYTGGTPNLNAIANIFGLDSGTIAIANLSDMVIGSVFYMFLLLACKPLLIKILKPSKTNSYLKQSSNIKNTEDLGLNKIRYSASLLFSVLIATGMAILSAGAGIILWILLGSKPNTMLDLLVPSLMLGVTIFGIIGSFSKKIREIEGTNVIGQYLILVFSFALASAVDFSRLQNQFVQIVVLYGLITTFSFILHVIFAKILKIDVDCTIITATAGIYGPAFIPALTKQIKNDSLTVPGLICGSIGYAIGTFVGVAFGLLYML